MHNLTLTHKLYKSCASLRIWKSCAFPPVRQFLRAFVFCAALGCAFVATTAQAQQIESCKPETVNAMRAAAEARLAYALAVIDQIYEKDDSVLALTCFNQTVGAAMRSTGDIFSGDYSATVANVVEPTLREWYENFRDPHGFTPPLGVVSGAVDYTNVTVPTNGQINCAAIEDLWAYISNNGVNTEVPYAIFDDLVSGDAPDGAGPEFRASWNTPSSRLYYANLQQADAAQVNSRNGSALMGSGNGANSVSFACVRQQMMGRNIQGGAVNCACPGGSC